MSEKGLKPCAKWTPDCQGKWDFDGSILRVSTRYWPRGGGFSVWDGNNFLTNVDQLIRPSAHSEIVLDHGEPNESNHCAEPITIADRKFEADTEAEVKATVEAWVKKQFDRIRLLLCREPAALDELVRCVEAVVGGDGDLAEDLCNLRAALERFGGQR